MQEYTQKYFEQSEVWKETMETYQYNVLNDILRIIPNDVESILDVGCGNGLITNKLPHNIKIVGVDLSNEALQFVKKEKVIGDIRNIPFEDNSFDMVMANDVIEHLSEEDRKLALREISRVAKKYIIVTVPFMEDLNMLSVKCDKCKELFHVNHHKHSFKLGELKNLLDESNCAMQILSGDIWQKENPDVTLIKKYLTIDNNNNNAICPQCGSNITEKSYENQMITTYLNRIAAMASCNDKHLIDMCMLRTECISLYVKNSEFNCNIDKIKEQYKKSKDFKELVLYNNEIDFSKSSAYKKDFLPVYSTLPYVLYTKVSEGYINVNENERILFGFFCEKHNKEKPFTIKLKGKVLNEELCKISVYPYDDLKGYVEPIIFNVKGEFQVETEVEYDKVSSYGFLFEIKCDNKDLILKQIGLYNTDKKEILVYEKDDNSFMQLEQLGDVYLSLNIYNNYILEREWFKNSSMLNKESSINIFDSELYKKPMLNLTDLLLKDIEKLDSENKELYKKNNNIYQDYLYFNNKYKDLLAKIDDVNFKYTDLIKKYEKLELDFQDINKKYNKTLEKKLKDLFRI